MKADATVQDDIPPVHVLEAAQNQERKETEDLLAGFDRPGRSPKPAPKERDFVDYYARKKPGAVDSGAGRRAAGGAGAGARSDAAQGPKGPRQGDLSTVIVPRKRERMPAWLGWGAVTLGMLLVGGAVAYLATSDAHPAAGGSASSAASAATTITSGTTPVQANADSNIPPPAPVEATPTTATAVTVVEPSPVAPIATGGTAKKRDGRSVPSASTAAAGAGVTASPPTNAARPTNATDDSTKPPPRDDFIRDL